MTRWRQQYGFSVIEFMILVALLCVAAAIGVPNFIEMQYRAQRAEVPTNIEGIRVAAVAYRAENGTINSESVTRPDANPGNRLRPWKGGPQFDALGWRPDGEVRGSYTLATTQQGTFSVKGFCDVDGNGRRANFEVDSQGNVYQLTHSDVY